MHTCDAREEAEDEAPRAGRVFGGFGREGQAAERSRMGQQRIGTRLRKEDEIQDLESGGSTHESDGNGRMVGGTGGRGGALVARVRLDGCSWHLICWAGLLASCSSWFTLVVSGSQLRPVRGVFVLRCNMKLVRWKVCKLQFFSLYGAVPGKVKPWVLRFLEYSDIKV